MDTKTERAACRILYFPGSERIDVPMDKPVVLRYRLIIHNGDAGSLDIPRLTAGICKNENQLIYCLSEFRSAYKILIIHDPRIGITFEIHPYKVALLYKAN